ncbi:MAG: sel1 repeat family protein [Cohaesibacteraceae bacterium]|nr:sel1 repeat family protein [Cohaesibacteraceae bacterium]
MKKTEQPATTSHDNAKNDAELLDEASVAACDLAVAEPYNSDNPDGVPGVAWFDIDRQDAIDKCRIAARKNPNNLRVRFQLARAYDAAGNESGALELVKSAAIAGYAIAQAKYGYRFENGFGVDEDTEQAVSWYQKSADQGDLYGQFYLGQMYEYGTGVGYDPALAIFWIGKAAQSGLPAAQYQLGNMYTRGDEFTPPNQALGIHWYRKAAEQEKAHAGYQLNLAKVLVQGSGAHVDYDEAAKWYLSCLENGHSKSTDLADLHISTISAMQLMMKSDGHYSGKIDGVAGTRTCAAMDALGPTGN